MTEEAKKKGIEIGIGLLLYIIAWSIVSYWTVPAAGETVLFLTAYAVLSLSTYWEQIKKILKKQFLDENLHIPVKKIVKTKIRLMIPYKARVFIKKLKKGL